MMLGGETCDGCAYELIEAVQRFTEGEFIVFSWTGSVHDPLYENIGIYGATEDDVLELGRRVANEFGHLNEWVLPKLTKKWNKRLQIYDCDLDDIEVDGGVL